MLTRIAALVALLVVEIVAINFAFAGDEWEKLHQPTNVVALFKQAVELGGYAEKCAVRQGGCPMPSVTITGLDPNIGGQFNPADPTIIKTNGEALVPGTLLWNSIVIHEFVHFLQWYFGELGPHSTCQDHQRIEEAAYVAGAKYLAQFGIVEAYSMQRLWLAMMCVA